MILLEEESPVVSLHHTSQLLLNAVLCFPFLEPVMAEWRWLELSNQEGENTLEASKYCPHYLSKAFGIHHCYL